MSGIPVIGIVLDLPTDNKMPPFSSYEIRENYAQVINDMGGIPIFLPFCENTLQNLSKMVDGIIIPGSGFDVPPELYKETASSPTVVTNKEKADFEIKILEIVKDKNIPFLGICYGMQLLNVFLGGSLIQHIPDEIKSVINHKPDTNREIPSHNITITKDTILFELADEQEQVMINSNHHQSVKSLGKDVIISAIADDGVIEAIEVTGGNFMMGVEWHPEYLKTNKLDHNVFKKFIQAAKTYSSNQGE